MLSNNAACAHAVLAFRGVESQRPRDKTGVEAASAVANKRTPANAVFAMPVVTPASAMDPPSAVLNPGKAGLWSRCAVGKSAKPDQGQDYS